MPNDVTAFFELLTAESGEYNAAAVGPLSYLKGVYLDVQPEVARNGQTIQVYFPDCGPFTHQGATDWIPEDISPDYVDLVFNQRPGKAILIRDFEQWQTSTDIRSKFIDPMLKRGAEYFNGLIAAQISPATFNVNPVIYGATPATVTVADSANAWNALATAKAPLDNPDDLNMFVHNTVHKNMMLDKDRYQENLVGAVIAQTAREKGDLGVAFNFRNRWDSQAPGAPVAYTGTVTAAGGSPALVGTGTAFTTQLYPGATFKIQGDTAIYTVASIQDATHLTATTNITAATGKTLASGGYMALAAHRYAIALALRPLELVNDGAVQSRLVMVAGIPFRVMVSYQHKSGGWLVTVDCGAACRVIRPEYGVLVAV